IHLMRRFWTIVIADLIIRPTKHRTFASDFPPIYSYEIKRKVMVKISPVPKGQNPCNNTLLRTTAKNLRINKSTAKPNKIEFLKNLQPIAFALI
ncbi:hypothetical protein, partial [Flavobacterium sp. ZS1P14]|uniref:hypothetical protein n=1 Tax=Flavobacterium sp. ZS1P14 TaxID=3401729 RepID=UPI003AADD40D